MEILAGPWPLRLQILGTGLQNRTARRAGPAGYDNNESRLIKTYGRVAQLPKRIVPLPFERSDARLLPSAFGADTPTRMLIHIDPHGPSLEPLAVGTGRPGTRPCDRRPTRSPVAPSCTHPIPRHLALGSPSLPPKPSCGLSDNELWLPNRRYQNRIHLWHHAHILASTASQRSIVCAPVGWSGRRPRNRQPHVS